MNKLAGTGTYMREDSTVERVYNREDTEMGNGASGKAESAAEGAALKLNKTITMAEIAKATKVSQGAISSLLNDRDYGIRVSPKTREKVFRICRELGYVPNDLRALVRMYPEMGMVSLLVSSDAGSVADNPLYCRILKGALAALDEASRSISLGTFEPAVDYLARPDLLPQPAQNGAASKFVCLGTPNFTLFEVIKKRELPVAVVDDDVTLPGVISIMPDYVEAAMQAIGHLFKLGHRRIGVLAGPFGSSERKIADLTHGVKLAFEQKGAPLLADYVVHGDLTFESGSKSLGHLLDQSPAPTAIFCFDDRIAAGALASARAKGLNVPRDFSIIGCCDHDFAAYLSPALTTIRVPAEELGAEAIHTIEQLVRDNHQPGARKISMPTTLVVRASTAAPKS